MSDSNLFPPLPPSNLDPEQVIHYLSALKNDGHTIYRDPGHDNIFFVQLTDAHRIRISVSIGRAQVQLHYLANDTAWLDATSMSQVERAVAELATKVPGVTWPMPPSTGRLSAATPASNCRTISGLIASSQVHAVFDPYLENSSLTSLLTVLSFGRGTIAGGVRLLGSTEKTVGAIPRLSKVGVDAWLAQLSIAGEARVVSARSEHRRFMLLSGGQSLILGLSLNAMHKNEAVHLESDTADRPFFEETWMRATPVP